MVNMMDAVALRAAVKKLQDANPTLKYDIDKFGTVYVNGIEYGTYYDGVHAKKSAMSKLRKSILAKKV